MCAQQTNTVKISRLRYRKRATIMMTTMRITRSPLVTLLVVLVVVAIKIPNIQASADYGEPEEDVHLNAAGNSEADSSNDEIYDPAILQQEVEASEHKISMQKDDMETESPNKDVHVRNATKKTKHSKHENVTAEEHVKELEPSNEDHSESEQILSDEYEDEYEQAHMMTTPKTKVTTMKLTNVPDYVRRKGKVELFTPPTMIASVEADDANVSLSDYVNDDEMLQQPEHFTHKHKHQLHTTMKVNTANDDDEDNADADASEMTDSVDNDDIVPLAMKFYQTKTDIEEDEELDNKIKEPAVQHKQQQLLPKQHMVQQFQMQTQNSSEEEYYEDSHESNEQLQKEQQLYHQQHRNHFANKLPHNYKTSKTTIAPINTPTSPTYSPPVQPSRPPPVPTVADVARAAIPASFPLSLGGKVVSSWPSTNAAIPNPAAVPIGIGSRRNDDDTTIGARTITTATDGLLESSMTTAAPPATSTATMLITTLRPAGKQGKQINITRRKLLPHEQLRNYIEDAYIRMPLAVIVDPSAESLEKTKALWRDALRTNLNIKIVLVSLNASGIPAAYNFNNTRQFLAGLNSIKEHEGGDAFIGIVHASELVPYDSAVFTSTAAIPPHTELVQDAAITLLKKRIRLYLIWYGERAISENETQDAVGGILGEVAIRSGGEILHIVGSENSQELEGSTLTMIADAFRGSQEVDIPVDTTLSSLHVKIDAPMRTATLETPNGG